MLNRRTLIVTGAGVLTTLMLGAAAAPGFATRAKACPGRIVCPLTGELVCADRCPLNGETDFPLPLCCAARSAK